MSRRVPLLHTERLLIRELTMADLPVIHDVLTAIGWDTSLDERARWLQWTVLGYEMFAELQQPHYGERAVVLAATNEIIGVVGIVPYRDNFAWVAALAPPAPDTRATAEVGLYWAIEPRHQRQGLATEAARALIEYLFNHERLDRLIATTAGHNLASQRVMQKLGMTLQAAEGDDPERMVVGVLPHPL